MVMKIVEKQIMKQNAHAVKYVKIQHLKNASPKIKAINIQVQRDFGLLGPITLSTPSTRVHALRWAMVRDSFIVETEVSRVTKEIVASAVAKLNKCPYCADAHNTSIVSAGDDLTAQSIDDNTWESLENEKTKQIINWSLNTRNPDANIIKNPPFSMEEAPEIIGTALVFHSTNRLASIFLENSPLPSFVVGKFMKKMVLSVASKTFFKTIVEKKAKLGEAEQFLSDIKIKEIPKWAKHIPSFANALAGKEVILQDISNEHIPENVAKLFEEYLSSWRGEEMPMRRGWLNDVLPSLEGDELIIAKLIFLSAFSPYMITQKDINAYRKINSEDKALIEVCFWSIEKLTLRISSWLVSPFEL